MQLHVGPPPSPLPALHSRPSRSAGVPSDRTPHMLGINSEPAQPPCGDSAPRCAALCHCQRSLTLRLCAALRRTVPMSEYCHCLSTATEYCAVPLSAGVPDGRRPRADEAGSAALFGHPTPNAARNRPQSGASRPQDANARAAGRGCVSRVDVKGYRVDAQGYVLDVNGDLMDAKGYMVDGKG
eukprot:2066645-Pyramimonas_sp.AAC.1